MWVFGYLFLDNHIIKTVNLLICKTGTGCESLKAAQGGGGEIESAGAIWPGAWEDLGMLGKRCCGDGEAMG